MAKKPEHYLKIPNAVLNVPGLGKGPKMLLAHVYSYGTKGCWQSNATLGRMFYVCERTITGWIATLKAARQILWLHPKGYYRTLWAKAHPDVRAAQALPYRGREIPKSSILSGQAKSAPLGKNLPSESAESCEVTRQKRVIPLGKNLPQTNNTTKKDTSKDTPATPAPLPAGGQAPALLTDRRKEAGNRVEQLTKGLGRAGRRAKPLAPDEFEQRRQTVLRQLSESPPQAAPPAIEERRAIFEDE